MHRSLLGFSLGIVALALAAGCGRDSAPTAPAASRGADRAAVSPLESATNIPGHGAGGFFPLQIGDRWSYDRRFWTIVHPADSAGTADSSLFEITFNEEMICQESHAGHDYTVMRVSYPTPEYEPYWVRFRQDRAGLYEWDNTSGPPACDTTEVGKGIGLAFNASSDRRWSSTAAQLHLRPSALAWKQAWRNLEAKRAAVEACGRPIGPRPPGGILAGEIQRLRYPLYPGQHWVIREEPNFQARVERAVMLRTPAGRFLAWSIRYTSELFGPDDVVRAFYGPQGYIGLRATLFSAATNENGEIIGTMEAHQDETLASIHLVGMHRLANDPLGRPTPASGE